MAAAWMLCNKCGKAGLIVSEQQKQRCACGEPFDLLTVEIFYSKPQERAGMPPPYVYDPACACEACRKHGAK